MEESARPIGGSWRGTIKQIDELRADALRIRATMNVQAPSAIKDYFARAAEASAEPKLRRAGAEPAPAKKTKSAKPKAAKQGPKEAAKAAHVHDFVQRLPKGYETPVAEAGATLSGGERNRVHLAKLLQKGSNLLLLDEPTNDLDVDTLRGLEEAILNFAGCAVVISHDRWFLDRVATHILAFEGDSNVVWFEGNYQDYEADRRRRLGPAADAPHRIKYRKLMR